MIEKMEFTKEEEIFKIGEKIFPVDFSMFHKPEDEINGYSSLPEYVEDELRDKLEAGIPLIVKSIPYQLRKFGLFEDEYYIEVVFEDSPETLYSIANTKTNVFKNLWEYIDFVEDCRACAACGY